MSSLMIYDTIYIYTKSIYKEFGVLKNIINNYLHNLKK